jgi:hypothetical protein
MFDLHIWYIKLTNNMENIKVPDNTKIFESLHLSQMKAGEYTAIQIAEAKVVSLRCLFQIGTQKR